VDVKAICQLACLILLANSPILQARTGVAQPARPASAISVSPEKIDFDGQTVGSSSPPKAATLTNVSNEGIMITDISASGIDFTESNDCPEKLAPGANCKIEVTFTPAINGPRLGTIIVSGSDPSGPRFLVLSGTGE
jgi:hypothetical protein